MKDGRNWNGYVGSNPTNRADPTGLLLATVLMLLVEAEVPPFPAGESVDVNIREIRESLMFEVEAGGAGFTMGIWTGSVAPHARWDYKRYHPDPERFDDAGNFNYGATGAALGIPLSVLLGVGEIDSWGLYFEPDQEDDKRMIINGYRYLESHDH